MPTWRGFIIGVLGLGLAACAASFKDGLRLNPPLAQARFEDRLRVAQMSNVAVLPFESLSSGSGASEVVTDIFGTALYGAKRFSTIMERAETVRRAKRAGIALAPIIDRATAQKVGRALNVDGVFFGTVTEYQYLFYPEDAVFGLRVELLDVESGQVVWSGLFNDRHYGLIQGSDEPITTLVQDGAAQLVSLLIPPVDPQYPYMPVTPDLTQHPKSLNAQVAP